MSPADDPELKRANEWISSFVNPSNIFVLGSISFSECVFEALFKGVTRFGDKTWKSASKPHSEKFVRPSKIFVWEV
jgi:hypothetical protein